jgi:hypothetical protein
MITNILIAGFAGLVILVILTAIIKALVAVETEGIERRLERSEWKLQRIEQKAQALCEQPYISPELIRDRIIAEYEAERQTQTDDAFLKAALEYEQAKARQEVAEWLEGATDSPNPDSSPKTQQVPTPTTKEGA